MTFVALIVDEDESAIESIKNALRPSGFKFTSTADGTEALELARTQPPDIVWLRVELPNVSGFSVCNRLRRDRKTQHIPLVLYASTIPEDHFDQHRQLKTHADEYLRLPFSPAELVRCADDLIERLWISERVPTRQDKNHGFPAPSSESKRTIEKNDRELDDDYTLASGQSRPSPESPASQPFELATNTGAGYGDDTQVSRGQADTFDLTETPIELVELDTEGVGEHEVLSQTQATVDRLSTTLAASQLRIEELEHRLHEAERGREQRRFHPITARESSPETLLRVDVRTNADGSLSARVVDDDWAATEATWQESTGVKVPDITSLRHRIPLDLVSEAEIDDVGRSLFAVLCSASGFEQTYDAKLSKATREAPLRIVLGMAPDQGAISTCSVADHFWEAALDARSLAGHRLGSSDWIRLVRHRTGVSAVTAPTPISPLRLTIAISSPTHREDGSPTELLNIVAEWQAFRELEREFETGGLLRLQYEPRIGRDNLQRMMNNVDVFHFAGHGQAGGLELQDINGQLEHLSAGSISDVIARPVPRLVVLNCCRSSMGSDSRGFSVAHAFLDRGVPATVAMHGDLSDASALLFSRCLYPSLIAGFDIETAVQQARCRMRFDGRHRLSWFLPVLWSRTATSFCLVDANSTGEQAEVARRHVDRLDIEIRHLRPRAIVLDRLSVAGIPLDVEARRKLADDLAARFETNDAESLDEEVEAQLDQDAIEGLMRRQILRPGTDDKSSLDALLRHEVIPRLDSVVSTIPSLFAVVLRSRSDATTVAVSEEDEVPPDADSTRGDAPLYMPRGMTLSSLVERVRDSLAIPDAVVERCITHLLAGRHLVLTGPPGTGKSTLAHNLASAFGFAIDVVTANPDWTTYDVIGGPFPVTRRNAEGNPQVGFDIRPGCFVDTVRSNWRIVRDEKPLWERQRSPGAWMGTWLLIDEMNRAPLDRAFGDLFTALVSTVVRVPRIASAGDGRSAIMMPIPRDFRLICTANTADRRLLFDLSEALKRRFAFVDVPAFVGSARGIGAIQRRAFLAQIERRASELSVELPSLEKRFDEVLEVLNPIVERIRVIFPLGSAQIIDTILYLLVASRLAGLGRPSDRIVGTALIDHFFPLIENLPAFRLRALTALLDGKLASLLREVFEIAAAGMSTVDDLLGTAADIVAFAVQVSEAPWTAVHQAIERARTDLQPEFGTLLATLPEADSLPKLAAASDFCAHLKQSIGGRA